jgi:hypothetical protein
MATYGDTSDTLIFVFDLAFNNLGCPVDVDAICVPPHSIAELNHDGADDEVG